MTKYLSAILKKLATAMEIFIAFLLVNSLYPCPEHEKDGAKDRV